MCTIIIAAVTHRRVGQVSSKYAQMEINVQRSRRDVGADRGERPAPVSPCNLLTTTTEDAGNQGIVTTRRLQYGVD
jgi:hypothetical protein